MARPIQARITLDDARYFAGQAREAERAGDTLQIRRYVTAAIVFGRSVTFHLQKEGGGDKNTRFWQWYEPVQGPLKADPLSRFFVEERNHVLKEGRLGGGRRLALSGLDIGGSSDIAVGLTVKRGRPWYRRRLKVLWEDFAPRPKRWLRGTGRRHRPLPRPKIAPPPVPTVGDVDRFFFHDAAWSDRPAIDLLDEYLDRLEEIVGEAERLFGGGEPE
jgi:hypothetical protein